MHSETGLERTAKIIVKAKVNEMRYSPPQEDSDTNSKKICRA